jgi:hypothetical protein
MRKVKSLYILTYSLWLESSVETALYSNLSFLEKPTPRVLGGNVEEFVEVFGRLLKRFKMFARIP